MSYKTLKKSTGSCSAWDRESDLNNLQNLQKEILCYTLANIKYIDFITGKVEIFQKDYLHSLFFIELLFEVQLEL